MGVRPRDRSAAAADSASGPPPPRRPSGRTPAPAPPRCDLEPAPAPGGGFASIQPRRTPAAAVLGAEHGAEVARPAAAAARTAGVRNEVTVGVPGQPDLDGPCRPGSRMGRSDPGSAKACTSPDPGQRRPDSRSRAQRAWSQRRSAVGGQHRLDRCAARARPWSRPRRNGYDGTQLARTQLALELCQRGEPEPLTRSAGGPRRGELDTSRSAACRADEPSAFAVAPLCRGAGPWLSPPGGRGSPSSRRPKRQSAPAFRRSAARWRGLAAAGQPRGSRTRADSCARPHGGVVQPLTPKQPPGVVGPTWTPCRSA